MRQKAGTVLQKKAVKSLHSLRIHNMQYTCPGQIRQSHYCAAGHKSPETVISAHSLRRCDQRHIPDHDRYIVLKLMTPPGPVMTYIISPVIDHGADPLAMQYFVQILQSFQALVLPGPSAAAHDYKRIVILADPGVILRHISQKTLYRIII